MRSTPTGTITKNLSMAWQTELKTKKITDPKTLWETVATEYGGNLYGNVLELQEELIVIRLNNSKLVETSKIDTLISRINRQNLEGPRDQLYWYVARGYLIMRTGSG